MKWSQFLLYLSSIYMLYYSINFLFDFLRFKRYERQVPEDETIFFAGEVEPTLVVTQDEPVEVAKPPSVNPVIISSYPIEDLQSTGGVSLKELFELAKQDVIQLTRPIPFV
ncbi:hypothetical protein [Desertivirga brevis]|uniref:hypothetical protein n=1 Tax=Desertivirga brevis TaxID=2810310 RepID=UPI001A97A1AB|nr:hypothetical protein [Pedobacter sp. SYSU D00873]